MTTEYGGRGDPQRSLELLWGTRKSPSRGPAPGLSVEQIVQAAIEIADAEGLTALSMRRVAERLAVGTMSLYTYIPGKAELLDLMLDTIFGEETNPASIEGNWRARLELRAREDWALFQRHSWALQVSSVRAGLGPNETGLFDATLYVVSEIGLSAREMVAAVNLIAGYVRGAATGVMEVALAAQQTGISDEQWWAAREPILDTYFDPKRFPTATRVAIEGAFDPPADGTNYFLSNALYDFEFGLQRVLDGIEALILHRSEQAEQR
ncbi:TetR/AcrR family transcriptional regulator [Ktedonosporobacter rubrisoli]|uniref:TetR/AcrR family transcriptional regulator n=1 Tax=Ktedonosporobacter rubrisoli TaxID=2509675 RepID=A0A4P6JI74_KTERU|nr:TetR/AcrR family transcriptional regulator [Ktedonosporobacter rubrisoli]QBD74755.1 TetR/AcrR family transcriptional regulator [Ktedonosporobacter rubrisoli]